jgi:hypothetical protein
MADRDTGAYGDDEETILEYSVRNRLQRPQIRDLLDGFGSQTSGSKDEMAERLLAVRGLRDKDVLEKLDIEDLKKIQKRFAIPPPSNSGSLIGMFLTDEKAELIKAILKVAGQQRTPRPRPAASAGAGAAEIRVAEPPAPAPTVAHPTSLPPPREVAPQARPPGSAVPGPGFEDVCAFVDNYRFRSNWPSEAHYEAELYGALTAKFLPSAVTRQERKTYGVPDITVKASVLPSGSIPTYIEMKVPENPGQVRAIEGQVKKYLDGGATNLIVVIVGQKMNSTVPLDEMTSKLEALNVRVSRKFS